MLSSTLTLIAAGLTGYYGAQFITDGDAPDLFLTAVFAAVVVYFVALAAAEREPRC